MRRKRYQKGSLRLRKHGRQKVWVAQWCDWRREPDQGLGPYSEITKGQAEVLLNSLQPLNVAAGHRQTPVFSFGQFVEKIFLPVYRQKWKESTRMTSEDRHHALSGSGVRSPVVADHYTGDKCRRS